MAKDEMCWYDWLALILLVVSGLNWGLVTWFGFDLVTWITVGIVWLTWTIKSLVGLAGIYGIVFLIKKAMGMK